MTHSVDITSTQMDTLIRINRLTLSLIQGGYIRAVSPNETKRLIQQVEIILDELVESQGEFLALSAA